MSDHEIALLRERAISGLIAFYQREYPRDPASIAYVAHLRVIA